MFTKLFLIKCLIYLSILTLSYEQQCILGKNCPYNQGICVSNICNCLSGYQTLLDPSLPTDQQIFCNYQKISQYTPLILEIFFPSIGHFIVGKYWMGLLKLALLIVFLSSSLYLYQTLKLPSFISSLFQYINIFQILGIGKEKGEGDANDDEIGEEGGEDSIILRKRNNKDKYVVKKQYHEEGEDKVDNKKQSNDNKDKYIELIFNLSGFFLSILYFMDLFFYKLGIYKDGNGVPFI